MRTLTSSHAYSCCAHSLPSHSTVLVLTQSVDVKAGTGTGSNEHRRRSSVMTLGGAQYLYPKNVLKISKVPEFYMILARKIIKIPEFF